jgi:hypothetical protein
MAWVPKPSERDRGRCRAGMITPSHGESHRSLGTFSPGRGSYTPQIVCGTPHTGHADGDTPVVHSALPSRESGQRLRGALQVGDPGGNLGGGRRTGGR